MAQCEIDSRQLFLYLDGELRERELTDFESHLSDCAACQLAVAGRRRFLDQVAGSRPTLTAPAELRARVEGILAGTQTTVTPAPAARLQGFIERALSALPTFRWVMPRTAFALTLLLAVVAGMWLERQTGRRPRSAFAVAALEAHQRRLHGGILLGIHSSSPEAISAYFRGKLAVNVKLPLNENLPPSQQPYQIEGAGITSFAGGQVGYIAYRVGNKPVSLLVAPASAVGLDGRKQVPMKSLLIHYDNARGYHIVTWLVPKKGISYALVSDESQHTNQSCIVCHAGPGDHDFMSALLSQ
jgi:anti-sigma factor RsiW